MESRCLLLSICLPRTKKGLEQVAYDELGHQLEGKEKSGTAVNQ